MGFFEKSFMQKAKDLATKGVSGIVNDDMRESLPLATSMNNPDGTVNTESLAKMQAQSRDVLSKAGNSFFGKRVLGGDALAGFQKMSEDAFSRQNALAEMMNDHQKAKLATQQEAVEKTDKGEV
jgi:hypothetical protein